MGRGGGGGGGGRSSGGGSHSRSFGGSSSRSSRGGSSHSTSRGGRSSSPCYPTPMPHVHISGNHCPPPPHHHHHHYGCHGHGTTYVIGGRAGRAISGFIVGTAVFVMLLIILMSMAAYMGDGVRKSTLEREKIKPYSAFDKGAIDDDAGWITDKKTLQRGMEAFFKKTGVQPALAVYTEINGEKYLSNNEVEAFMMDEYDTLVGHEKGVLLLFCEYADSDWYAYYMVGEDAQTVMDSEACDILIDYVHSLYTNNSYSDEEFFAAVFEKTGDRIMAVTPTAASAVPLIVIGVVVIAGMVFVFRLVKQKHKRDAEKAAETERILNSDISHI